MNRKSHWSDDYPKGDLSLPEIKQSAMVNFSSIRKSVIQSVVKRSLQDLALTKPSELEFTLGEALYQERYRLKKAKLNVFTYPRRLQDRGLWKSVRRALLRHQSEADRAQVLNRVVGHYAQEIAGRFRPKIYELATHAVPFCFNWLLNAASLNRFKPWDLEEQLGQRLHIEGEVTLLRNLSKKGTILLVPTHQSHIDSVLIGYVIYSLGLPPFAYGAGLNLFSNPILSFFMRGLGSYTVDRLKSNIVYKTVLKNYSTQILREGVHSIFFPGGGRSRSGAIETHLKLGLLGTGLEAQLSNLQENREKPNVYVVPMITSYDFVLEAANLLEEYLALRGKSRFIGSLVEEVPQIVKVVRFFWNFFASESRVRIRLGKPLDVFGNFVDENGVSLGPNGTQIDPKRWLSSRGKLCQDPQRDQEYTRELGNKLVQRYYAENVVLSSHLVAFTLFMVLRKKYRDLDVFRFLRLSLPQRSVPEEKFLEAAEVFHKRILELANRGTFHISDELKTQNTREWVNTGIKYLGSFHDAEVVKIQGGVVWTEDMNLLYYYRNRLSGYGLSLLGEFGRAKILRGQEDEQGFLA